MEYVGISHSTAAPVTSKGRFRSAVCLAMLTCTLFGGVLLSVRNFDLSQKLAVQSAEDCGLSAWCVLVGGPWGGAYENMLTSFFLRFDFDYWVALDAGCVLSSLHGAAQRGVLDFIISQAGKMPRDVTPPAAFHQFVLRSYFISHAHLDHISGLAVGSAEDLAGAQKKIYALPSTIEVLRDHIFNWKAWPDMPSLKTYEYKALAVAEQTNVGRGVMVRIYPLSHSTVKSSAFLFTRKQEDQQALLYLGDTGPDKIEKLEPGEGLGQLFKSLRSLNIRLSAIFLECSYDNSRPDSLLFGHLTPRYLAEALQDLDGRAGTALVVTHMKPQWKANDDWQGRIQQQVVDATRELGLRRVIFPKQGDVYTFGDRNQLSSHQPKG